MKHKSNSSRYGWLGGAGLLLSLLACYGTLGLVVLLSFVGISLAINVNIWAAAIVAFALVAVMGIGAGLRRHRHFGPVALALAGTLLIIWAMYGSQNIRDLLGVPSRAVELAGFAGLVTATIWDWRLKKAGR